METISTKTDRIEARVSPRTKEILVKAAAIQGRTLSDFVVDALLEKAERVIEAHEVIVLTEEDRRVFFEALRNPPPPNAALRKAHQAHRELVGDQV